MTSMLVNAGFAPQPAIPASIIFKERPLLEQVDAKELAKKLLTKNQFSCLGKLLGKESAWKPTAKTQLLAQRASGNYSMSPIATSE
jgi:hypothetical protein